MLAKPFMKRCTAVHLRVREEKLCVSKTRINGQLIRAFSLTTAQWANIRKKVQFREASLFLSKAKINGF